MKNCTLPFSLPFIFCCLIYSPAGARGIPDESTDEKIHHIVSLVKEAAALVQTKGEACFNEFRIRGSQWRKGETFIYIMDLKGNMLLHPSPDLEGRNNGDLSDVNGKPIVRGMLASVTSYPDKTEGWYHYQWPVPGGLIQRWKSSFNKLVSSPSGKKYVLSCNMYDDRMAREFVIDLVKDAVRKIEKEGAAAFPVFHDPKSPYIAKDGYIFVVNPAGQQIINAGFPELEGKNMLDLKDVQGKFFVQEMIRVIENNDAGWVDYMWPKAGESVATQKSAYIGKARMGGSWVLVGCGVYLNNAPKLITKNKKTSAEELMTLVHAAAAELEKNGENAFPVFRNKDGSWNHDDLSLELIMMDGTEVFQASHSENEGSDLLHVKDLTGRPYVQMMIERANTQSGKGWVHYLHNEPGQFFPCWKSNFVQQVTLASGKRYLITSGVCNMEMNASFIEDLVNHAVEKIEEKGINVFNEFRNKKGPYYFMNAAIFVDQPNGIELVNADQPSLEGKDLLYFRDLKGRPLVKEQIDLAMKEGSGWLDGNWFLPGTNVSEPKRIFVKKAVSQGKIYIVGSSYYPKND